MRSPHTPVAPDTDTGFWIIYGLSAPLYVCGLVLNVLVLAGLRQLDSKSRMDFATRQLLATTGGYALFQGACQGGVLLVADAPAYGSFAAAGSALLVVALVACNVLLALERHLSIKHPRAADTAARRCYAAVAAVAAAAAVVLLAVFCTSDTLYDIQPTQPLQYNVWIICMSTVFILGVSTATFLYWSTYVYVAERLRHATGVSHTEEIARKVLIRCILMSSGMLVCYLPRMIVQLTVNSQTYYDSFTTSIANVFASFDVVLTPALILYFRPDVRIKIVNAFASNNNNQRTDEEQPHPAAASSTQTIVDIHERK